MVLRPLPLSLKESFLCGDQQCVDGVAVAWECADADAHGGTNALLGEDMIGDPLPQLFRRRDPFIQVRPRKQKDTLVESVAGSGIHRSHTVLYDRAQFPQKLP